MKTHFYFFFLAVATLCLSASAIPLSSTSFIPARSDWASKTYWFANFIFDDTLAVFEPVGVTDSTHGLPAGTPFSRAIYHVSPEEDEFGYQIAPGYFDREEFYAIYYPINGDDTHFQLIPVTECGVPNGRQIQYFTVTSDFGGESDFTLSADGRHVIPAVLAKTSSFSTWAENLDETADFGEDGGIGFSFFLEMGFDLSEELGTFAPNKVVEFALLEGFAGIRLTYGANPEDGMFLEYDTDFVPSGSVAPSGIPISHADMAQGFSNAKYFDAALRFPQPLFKITDPEFEGLVLDGNVLFTAVTLQTLHNIGGSKLGAINFDSSYKNEFDNEFVGLWEHLEFNGPEDESFDKIARIGFSDPATLQGSYVGVVHCARDANGHPDLEPTQFSIATATFGADGAASITWWAPGAASGPGNAWAFGYNTTDLPPTHMLLEVNTHTDIYNRAYRTDGGAAIQSVPARYQFIDSDVPQLLVRAGLHVSSDPGQFPGRYCQSGESDIASGTLIDTGFTFLPEFVGSNVIGNLPVYPKAWDDFSFSFEDLTDWADSALVGDFVPGNDFTCFWNDCGFDDNSQPSASFFRFHEVNNTNPICDFPNRCLTMMIAHMYNNQEIEDGSRYYDVVLDGIKPGHMAIIAKDGTLLPGIIDITPNDFYGAGYTQSVIDITFWSPTGNETLDYSWFQENNLDYSSLFTVSTSAPSFAPPVHQVVTNGGFETYLPFKFSNDRDEDWESDVSPLHAYTFRLYTGLETPATASDIEGSWVGTVDCSFSDEYNDVAENSTLNDYVVYAGFNSDGDYYINFVGPIQDIEDAAFVEPSFSFDPNSNFTVANGNFYGETGIFGPLSDWSVPSEATGAFVSYPVDQGFIEVVDANHVRLTLGCVNGLIYNNSAVEVGATDAPLGYSFRPTGADYGFKLDLYRTGTSAPGGTYPNAAGIAGTWVCDNNYLPEGQSKSLAAYGISTVSVTGSTWTETFTGDFEVFTNVSTLAVTSPGRGTLDGRPFLFRNLANGELEITHSDSSHFVLHHGVVWPFTNPLNAVIRTCHRPMTGAGTEADLVGSWYNPRRDEFEAFFDPNDPRWTELEYLTFNGDGTGSYQRNNDTGTVPEETQAFNLTVPAPGVILLDFDGITRPGRFSIVPGTPGVDSCETDTSLHLTLSGLGNTPPANFFAQTWYDPNGPDGDGEALIFKREYSAPGPVENPLPTGLHQCYAARSPFWSQEEQRDWVLPYQPDRSTNNTFFNEQVVYYVEFNATHMAINPWNISNGVQMDFAGDDDAPYGSNAAPFTLPDLAPPFAFPIFAGSNPGTFFTPDDLNWSFQNNTRPGIALELTGQRPVGSPASLDWAWVNDEGIYLVCPDQFKPNLEFDHSSAALVDTSWFMLFPNSSFFEGEEEPTDAQRWIYSTHGHDLPYDDIPPEFFQIVTFDSSGLVVVDQGDAATGQAGDEAPPPGSITWSVPSPGHLDLTLNLGNATVSQLGIFEFTKDAAGNKRMSMALNPYNTLLPPYSMRYGALGGNRYDVENQFNITDPRFEEDSGFNVKFMNEAFTGSSAGVADLEGIQWICRDRLDIIPLYEDYYTQAFGEAWERKLEDVNSDLREIFFIDGEIRQRAWNLTSGQPIEPFGPEPCANFTGPFCVQGNLTADHFADGFINTTSPIFGGYVPIIYDIVANEEWPLKLAVVGGDSSAGRFPPVLNWGSVPWMSVLECRDGADGYPATAPVENLFGTWDFYDDPRPAILEINSGGTGRRLEFDTGTGNTTQIDVTWTSPRDSHITLSFPTFAPGLEILCIFRTHVLPGTAVEQAELACNSASTPFYPVSFPWYTGADQTAYVDSWPIFPAGHVHAHIVGENNNGPLDGFSFHVRRSVAGNTQSFASLNGDHGYSCVSPSTTSVNRWEDEELIHLIQFNSPTSLDWSVVNMTSGDFVHVVEPLGGFPGVGGPALTDASMTFAANALTVNLPGFNVSGSEFNFPSGAPVRGAFRYYPANEGTAEPNLRLSFNNINAPFAPTDVSNGVLKLDCWAEGYAGASAFPENIVHVQLEDASPPGCPTCEGFTLSSLVFNGTHLVPLESFYPGFNDDESMANSTIPETAYVAGNGVVELTGFFGARYSYQVASLDFAGLPNTQGLFLRFSEEELLPIGPPARAGFNLCASHADCPSGQECVGNDGGDGDLFEQWNRWNFTDATGSDPNDLPYGVCDFAPPNRLPPPFIGGGVTFFSSAGPGDADDIRANLVPGTGARTYSCGFDPPADPSEFEESDVFVLWVTLGSDDSVQVEQYEASSSEGNSTESFNTTLFLEGTASYPANGIMVFELTDPETGEPLSVRSSYDYQSGDFLWGVPAVPGGQSLGGTLDGPEEWSYFLGGSRMTCRAPFNGNGITAAQLQSQVWTAHERVGSDPCGEFGPPRLMSIRFTATEVYTTEVRRECYEWSGEEEPLEEQLVGSVTYLSDGLAIIDSAEMGELLVSYGLAPPNTPFPLVNESDPEVADLPELRSDLLTVALAPGNWPAHPQLNGLGALQYGELFAPEFSGSLAAAALRNPTGFSVCIDVDGDEDGDVRFLPIIWNSDGTSGRFATGYTWRVNATWEDELYTSLVPFNESDPLVDVDFTYTSSGNGLIDITFDSAIVEQFFNVSALTHPDLGTSNGIFGSSADVDVSTFPDSPVSGLTYDFFVALATPDGTPRPYSLGPASDADPYENARLGCYIVSPEAGNTQAALLAGGEWTSARGDGIYQSLSFFSDNTFKLRSWDFANQTVSDDGGYGDGTFAVLADGIMRLDLDIFNRTEPLALYLRFDITDGGDTLTIASNPTDVDFPPLTMTAGIREEDGSPMNEAIVADEPAFTDSNAPKSKIDNRRLTCTREEPPSPFEDSGPPLNYTLVLDLINTTVFELYLETPEGERQDVLGTVNSTTVGAWSVPRNGQLDLDFPPNTTDYVTPAGQEDPKFLAIYRFSADDTEMSLAVHPISYIRPWSFTPNVLFQVEEATLWTCETGIIPEPEPTPEPEPEDESETIIGNVVAGAAIGGAALLGILIAVVACAGSAGKDGGDATRSVASDSAATPKAPAPPSPPSNAGEKAPLK